MNLRLFNLKVQIRNQFGRIRRLLKLFYRPRRVLLIDLDELRDDPGFRISWVANIAMSIKDEFHRERIKVFDIEHPETFYRVDAEDMHRIANNGAEKFIDLLTHEPAKRCEDF